MNYLLKYPTPIAGLALGLAGLGGFWSSIAANNVYMVLFAVFSGLLLVPLLLKFILHSQQLAADLQHPTVGSIVPTITMALMMMSHAIDQYNIIAGTTLWLLACAAHICFMLMFFYHRVRSLNLDHIIPSWYVPPIGIVVAALTVPMVQLHFMGTLFVYFGLASYTIMLPLVLYRLIMGGRIESARQPTLAILAAPPSLILVGYLTMVANPNLVLVISLFAIASLMTLVVYLLLLQLLRLPFSPAYSAFTFPLVISATAMHTAAIYFATMFGKNSMYWVSKLTTIEAVIASLVVAYVTCHYLRSLYIAYWQPKNNCFSLGNSTPNK